MSFMEKLNLNLFKFILIFFLTLSNLAFSETKIISYNAIKLGLWQGDFDMPEDWRKKNK